MTRREFIEKWKPKHSDLVAIGFMRDLDAFAASVRREAREEAIAVLTERLAELSHGGRDEGARAALDRCITSLCARALRAEKCPRCGGEHGKDCPALCGARCARPADHDGDHALRTAPPAAAPRAEPREEIRRAHEEKMRAALPALERVHGQVRDFAASLVATEVTPAPARAEPREAQTTAEKMAALRAWFQEATGGRFEGMTVEEVERELGPAPARAEEPPRTTMQIFSAVARREMTPEEGAEALMKPPKESP